MNTDLDAVFELVLRKAQAASLAPEHMVRTLFIFSVRPVHCAAHLLHKLCFLLLELLAICDAQRELHDLCCSASVFRSSVKITGFCGWVPASSAACNTRHMLILNLTRMQDMEFDEATRPNSYGLSPSFSTSSSYSDQPSAAQTNFQTAKARFEVCHHRHPQDLGALRTSRRRCRFSMHKAWCCLYSPKRSHVSRLHRSVGRRCRTRAQHTVSTDP